MGGIRLQDARGHFLWVPWESPVGLPTGPCSEALVVRLSYGVMAFPAVTVHGQSSQFPSSPDEKTETQRSEKTKLGLLTYVQRVSFFQLNKGEGKKKKTAPHFCQSQDDF